MMPMKRLILWAACVLIGGLLACGSEPITADEQARLEKEFQESMTDVVLVGNFTVTGRGDDARLRPERYEVKSVNHVAGDIWTFTTRIQYGDHDVTVPVPVKLMWAGDTPVVTLTDAEIPGVGTFTARVVFFRDHYSGMWWHGETGGNQFGRILRGEEAKTE
jgi:hypothetical protein